MGVSADETLNSHHSPSHDRRPLSTPASVEDLALEDYSRRRAWTSPEYPLLPARRTRPTAIDLVGFQWRPSTLCPDRDFIAEMVVEREDWDEICGVGLFQQTRKKPRCRHVYYLREVYGAVVGGIQVFGLATAIETSA